MPVGYVVSRTADRGLVDVLPAAPDARNTSILMVLSRTSILDGVSSHNGYDEHRRERRVPRACA